MRGTMALLVLALLAAPMSAAVVGIDLGSSFVKVASGRHGSGVQIALNSASKRKTPNAVGFHQEGRRVWGDDALVLMGRHPGRGLPFSSSFLGRQQLDPEVHELASAHPGYALGAHRERGSVLLGEVMGRANQTSTSVSCEVAVAMMLEHSVRAIALEPHEKAAEGVVVTVPGWSTVSARMAMQTAGSIAGLKVLALMNDHAAVALRYAMDQKFGSSPRYVIFFDMGGGGTKVSLVEFYTAKTNDLRHKGIEHVTVKGVAFDELLGGRAFDKLIAEMIMEHATTKLKPGQTVSTRSRARIQKEAEKIRKVLSANKEGVASVDSLTEETDLRMEISRAKFEARAMELFDRVLTPVTELLEQASRLHGFTLSDLHSVEVVGGASRMPMVQSKLSGFFGKHLLKNSLNGDESAALGATFYAAMLNGYNVRPFNLVDLVPYHLQMVGDASEVTTVHQPDWHIPSSLTLQVEQGARTLRLLEPRSHQHWNLTVDPANSSSSLVMGVDRSGLPVASGLHRFVSHPKEVGPPAWSREILNLTMAQAHGAILMAEQLQGVQDLRWWQQKDELFEVMAETQNQLESFLFGARDRLESEELQQVSTEEQRAVLRDAIERADEWLLSEDAKSVGELAGQEAKVKMLLEPLVQRQQEIERRPEALANAKASLTKVVNVLSKLKEMPASNDTAIANDTALEIARLGEDIEVYQTWLSDKEETQSVRAYHEAPAFLSTELETRTKDLLVRAAQVATKANLTAATKKP